ncbi:glycosyltransferase family 87 protein [Rhodovulum sulfidophilum]|uniref:DUF2029 domain-containing protein n=1 Tax=Rhodovulum sulfidophilum TaxID=35806 RepID=A0ABS1RW24_RHOSU|nr:glycosyltransferase family 87 protein [Rhodovulum sulfidophilum]MBL3610289.1 DUF2029 domain-containing protein [Rhodovulum sulfidophilum]MCE8455111.1 DUF2029 domain-containing protein [Rhodovulum sulfidophilum]
MLLLGLQVAMVGYRLDFYQYDFRAFYIAANLFAVGGEPYSFEELVRVSKGLGLSDNNHPFLYHPLTLFIFEPLSDLSYRAAYSLWLFLQVSSLAIIAWVCIRFFKIPAPWLLPMMAVGLNGAIAANLRAGQLTLMTLAMILLASAMVMRNRAAAATVFIVLCAIPKLWVTPALGLLLNRISSGRMVLVASGALAILAALGLSYYLAPDDFRKFLTVAERFSGGSEPGGASNGSSRNMLASLAGTAGFDAAQFKLIWVLWIVSVLGISLLAWTRLLRDGATPYPELFSLVLLSICLVMPRMATYQWTIAIPAVAHIAATRPYPVGIPLTAIAVMPTLYIGRYCLDRPIEARADTFLEIAFYFANLWSVLGAWLILCVSVLLLGSRGRRRENYPVSAVSISSEPLAQRPR